jgi:hypothetical protein
LGCIVAEVSKTVENQLKMGAEKAGLSVMKYAGVLLDCYLNTDSYTPAYGLESRLDDAREEKKD